MRRLYRHAQGNDQAIASLECLDQPLAVIAVSVEVAVAQVGRLPTLRCPLTAPASRRWFLPERQFVAISAQHPLADHEAIDFSEIISEPVAALPVSAGGQRDFWLATYARAGRAPQVAAEVNSADAKFEIVSSGATITLLAEGNADVYTRPGIVCIPSSASSRPGWQSPGGAVTAGHGS